MENSNNLENKKFALTNSSSLYYSKKKCISVGDDENKLFNYYFLNYEDFKNAESSRKSFGIISSYAANTYKGSFRKQNEDKISIIYKIIYPINRCDENWPNISYFGLFDGHAGDECAEFLKLNLHHYVELIKLDMFSRRISL